MAECKEQDTHQDELLWNYTDKRSCHFKWLIRKQKIIWRLQSLPFIVAKSWYSLFKSNKQIRTHLTACFYWPQSVKSNRNINTEGKEQMEWRMSQSNERVRSLLTACPYHYHRKGNLATCLCEGNRDTDTLRVQEVTQERKGLEVRHIPQKHAEPQTSVFSK